VLGSMFGNSLSATGSSSSMNGTITNTANGMSRSRSCVVRLSYRAVCLVMASSVREEEEKGAHLPALTPGEAPAAEDLELEARRDADLGHEQLAAVPVVLRLVLDLLPHARAERRRVLDDVLRRGRRR
jgi:hypothetical protein